MKGRMREGPRRPKQPTPEEGIDTEKVQTILKEQTGPGGCTNIQECQKYCMDFNHVQECMEFAVKHRITKTPGDLERMKKMSQIKSGPGGCMEQMSVIDFVARKKTETSVLGLQKKIN